MFCKYKLEMCAIVTEITMLTFLHKWDTFCDKTSVYILSHINIIYVFYIGENN